VNKPISDFGFQISDCIFKTNERSQWQNDLMIFSKHIKSFEIGPSPHPSPQRGEGWVRGPHVKEINAFVLALILMHPKRKESGYGKCMVI